MVIVNFFIKLWCNYIKLFWSKIRWCGKRKIKAVPCTESLTSLGDIRQMCKTVYRSFEWTMDDISELFDSFAPVEYLYNYYRDSEEAAEKFKDDCDGYHSVIYHILTQCGYDAALLTIATSPISKSHTMTLFKLDGKYYLVNYTSIIEYNTTDIQAIVDDYNNARGFKKEHHWVVQKYNYDKAAFYNVKDY